MSDLHSAFREALDRMLERAEGASVGGAAGWCRRVDGGLDQGIVYAGKVASRADDELIAPPGDETAWQIGSVSKTFTATLLALAAAERPQLLTGSVLDDIGPWLGPRDPLPPQLRAITHNRLVSMWAGLVKSNRRLGSSSASGYPVADLFRNLLEHGSYTSQPCTWLYSNLSIALLGWALTSIYGVAPASPAELPAAFLALLREQLLDPLGIAATWSADADPRHLPVGWAHGKPTTEPDLDFPADDPAGALTLTAPALLAWVAANLGPGERLTGDVLQLLRTPIVPTEAVETGDGGSVTGGGASCRGWFLIPSSASPGSWLYNKNGRVRGFVAGVAYAPPATLPGESAAGVFVVANDSDLEPERVAESLLALALADGEG